MSIEEKVIRHYGSDNQGAAILEKARQQAADPDKLTIDDLAAYDELHIGGRPATRYFSAKLGLEGGMTVLDVGSGLGGPARYMAASYGAEVTGVDLSPGFCAAAATISKALDLDGKTSFHQGSVTALPFGDAHFDAAYMIHVGMNIADKAKVYHEVFRVLKPGGVFGIYDILAAEGADTGDLVYPLPWAETPETSFLETESAVSLDLEAAGFAIEIREDSRDFAISAFDKIFGEKALLARARHPERLANLLGNIRNSLCGPWVIICRKPE